MTILATLMAAAVAEAAKNVVPVAVTAAESVERLRDRAAGRCLNADVAGIYTRNGSTQSRRRKVRRGSIDPSAN
jgi:hypothetical protein